MKVTITVDDAAVVETTTQETPSKAKGKPAGAPTKPAVNPTGVTVHLEQAEGDDKVVAVPEPLASLLRSIFD